MLWYSRKFIRWSPSDDREFGLLAGIATLLGPVGLAAGIIVTVVYFLYCTARFLGTAVTGGIEAPIEDDADLF